MTFPASTSRREGFVYRRVLVPRKTLGRYRPDPGWELVCYGPPWEEPGTDIAITLRQALPPSPRVETVVMLAMEFLRPNGCCTVSWMAAKLGLSPDELVQMLISAGLPRHGSERPWLRHGDWLLWFHRRDELRAKPVEKPDDFTATENEDL